MQGMGEKGDMPERSNGVVSKTVAGLVTTSGSNPTLSAGHKIPLAAEAAY